MNGSWVQQTAWNIVTYILDSAMRDASNVAWGWFSRLYVVPLSVVDDPTAQRLVQMLIGVVLGALPVAIAWLVIKETAARLDGTSTTPPEALIRRAMVAGVAVTGTSLVAWFMHSLADYARELIVGVGIDLSPLHALFQPAPDSGLVLLVLLLAFVVGAIVLLVQRAVVMAETTVLLAIGPLMAVGLLRDGGSTSWNVWLRELTSLLVTGLVQLLVTLIFLRKFAGGDSGLGIELMDAGTGPGPMSRIAALGFLWVLWNTPRWARQMVYSVGAGGGIVGGAANLTRMVVMRKIIASAAKAAV